MDIISDKGIEVDTCVLKKDCNFCNCITSEQKIQLSIPTQKDQNKSTSLSPCLVNPGRVKILGQVKTEKTTKATTTSKKMVV